MPHPENAMTKGEYHGTVISVKFEITLPDGPVADATRDVLRGFTANIDRVISSVDEKKALELMNQTIEDLRILKEKIELELPPPLTN